MTSSYNSLAGGINSGRAHGVRKSSTGFFVSVAALAGGAVVARGLGVLAAPVTSRLFAPEAFGLAALFAAFSSLLMVVSSLRYQMAILLPRTDEDAANIVGLCGLIVIMVSLLTGLVFRLFGGSILEVLNATEIRPYLWLLPLSVFVAGMSSPLQYWHSRHKRFKALGACRGGASGAGVGIRVGGGLLGYQTGGNLIVLTVIAGAAQFMMLLGLLKDDVLFLARHISLARMWTLAKRYVKFPLLDTWSGLMNRASQQAPVILLIAFFGSTVVGHYFLALSLLFLPMTLIGEAISQVFFQRVADMHAAGEVLSNTVQRGFRRLAGLGVLPLLMLAVVGPELFAFALGARWRESGVYAQFLSFWILGMFIISPLSVLFNVLERQGALLVFNIVFLAARVAAILVGGLVLANARLSIVLFSAVGVVFCITQCAYVLRTTGIRLRTSFFCFVRFILYASPALVVTALLKWWFQIDHVWLLCAAAAASLSYYVFLLREDAELREKLVGILRKVRMVR